MWWKYGLIYTSRVATGVLGGFYYIQQSIQRDINNFSSNKSNKGKELKV